MSPKRVVVLIDELTSRGGVANSTRQLYQALSDRGVVVGLLYGKDGDARDEWLSLSGAVLNAGGTLLLPTRRPVESLIRASKAVRFALRFAPDVVFVHSPRQFRLGWLISRLASAELVVQLRTDPPPLSRISKAIVRTAESRVCVSEHVREAWSERLRLQEEKFRVIYTGVSPLWPPPSALDRAQVRREFGLPEAGRLVAFLGRLDPEKGVLDAIQAFSAVRSSWADISMCIAGDASTTQTGQLYGAAVEKQCQLSGVTMLGHVKQPERLLAVVDALLMPTYRDALPRAAVEASVYGLVVLAYRVGGVPEILFDSLSRFMVTAGDVGALAGLLAEWAAGTLELADEEHQAVMVRFGFDEYVERYLELLGAQAGTGGF